MSSDKAVADKYQALSDIEHILLRPDTYVGSCSHLNDDIFIADITSDQPKIIKKNIMYIQGLERIYEEALLNAFDRTVTEGTGCTEIHVSIDQDTGTISLMNNGDGIPVIMKSDLGCYIPEMIFGMLRTGSNYSDSEERLTGGRNGLGIKLTNILSKEFSIETIDSERKKHYTQSWSDNMGKKNPPVITATRKKPFTRITFKPDLSYFKLDKLTDDIVMLMKKRLVDIGYASHAGVKTYYNGTLISIKKPEDYMKLYDHPDGEKFLVDNTNERWSVGVVCSQSGFQHASFVNGIHTSIGGSHVDHVVNQIAKEIIDKLKTKKIEVKPSDIKNKMFVFVRSAIINPVFDSQSKECLKMAKTKFGSEFIMSDAFRKKLHTSSILKSMTAVSDTKKMKDLEKTSGTKANRITDIDVLEDATWAGTPKALQTKLILTEGLSARTFAMSGLNVIGRNQYGIFPLKGKLLNVRNVSITKVSANEEIKNLVKILGLKYDLTYESDQDMNTLRYGGVVALTDSDHDGTHITGLLINYFHNFFPKLIERGFINFCITPIVKVYKGKEVFEFYTLNSYDDWLKKSAKGQFRTKYFKGLGTSTPEEAREALRDIDSKLIKFERDDSCDETVSLAFNNKRADDRKEWLMNEYDPLANINRGQREVDVSDFINLELSHFSTYDCSRSIPCILDGFKPSQRKIIHVSLKYISKNEMKVGQLGPKVSEMTDYHHGEQSLMGAIINMAQDYVGSNNLNLLLPVGAFGSRISGGSDAAFPRYIFTKLNPISNMIFNSKDSSLLKYLDSDGSSIEPEWYVPVLPMIVINGALGIGTGFSTTILQHNPRNVIHYLQSKLMNEQPKKNLKPWYRGFNGTIEEVAPNKFITYGVWSFDDRKRCLNITELPINTWTDDYTSFCKKLLAKKDGPLIDVIYGNTDTVIDFKLMFNKDSYNTFKAMSKEDIVKELNLSSKLSSTNMYLFNEQGRIQKFNDVYDIIDYYFHIRLNFYEKRKDAMIQQLIYEILILSNKAKFISFVKEGKINQRTMTEDTLLKSLKKDFDEDSRATGSGLSLYEYLISMTYRSFTNENKAKMEKAVELKAQELKELEAKTREQLWLDDLKEIDAML